MITEKQKTNTELEKLMHEKIKLLDQWEQTKNIDALIKLNEKIYISGWCSYHKKQFNFFKVNNKNSWTKAQYQRLKIKKI